MNWEAKQWQKRVQIYEQTGKAGLMCLRCGISRPRMCKWWGRYQAEGIKGLMSRNRPPKEIPFRKATPEIEQWVLHIRQNQTIGSRRIQRELQRLHDVRLSSATIHKVLERNQVTPLRRPSRRRRASQYEKKALGAQLQIARSSSKPSKRCRFPSSAARRTKALSARPMTSKGPGVTARQEAIEQAAHATPQWQERKSSADGSPKALRHREPNPSRSTHLTSSY